MLDELKEEGIVNKVGGRFKLSTLIQKRMVALNTGAKPQVDIRGADKLTIVIQEILQDKIFLDSSGIVQTRNQTVMANLPGAYPGMPGAVPPSPGGSGAMTAKIDRSNGAADRPDDGTTHRTRRLAVS